MQGQFEEKGLLYDKKIKAKIGLNAELKFHN